jgi:hypothetical protein
LQRGFKKTKKCFGESKIRITFAELSPEKIVVNVTEETTSSLKIFEKERRQTTNE